MSKIYFYKLTADDGGAPCVDRGLLSLAICKPMIRRTAEIDDLVFGFAADCLSEDNRLIYIARITAKLEHGEYYSDQRYQKREDSIYEVVGGRYRWRQKSLHHGPGDVVHDLGAAPGYDRASTLLSTDFRYRGKDGTAGYKTRFPLVKGAVERMQRGHRVHHQEGLLAELRAMKDWAWQTYQATEIGQPTTSPLPDACHRTRDCGIVSAG